MKQIGALALALLLCVGAALAEPDPQAVLADYVGVWEGVLVEQNGMQFSMQEANMSMHLTVIGSGEVYIQEGMAETLAFAVEAEDGLLLLVEDVQVAVLVLDTDGTMRCVMEQDNTTVVFERTEE